MGFGYYFLGLDALVQIHERHYFDAPRFIHIDFGLVVLFCERVVSEFVFELVLGFNGVDVHGHSIINYDGAVGGVHYDVSLRQVEVDDFFRVQQVDALCQTGVYVEYLVVYVCCRVLFGIDVEIFI